MSCPKFSPKTKVSRPLPPSSEIVSSAAAERVGPGATDERVITIAAAEQVGPERSRHATAESTSPAPPRSVSAPEPPLSVSSPAPPRSVSSREHHRAHFTGGSLVCQEINRHPNCLELDAISTLRLNRFVISVRLITTPENTYAAGGDRSANLAAPYGRRALDTNL